MHDSGIWKREWGLNVPVKKNLKNRQILPDDICNHCKQSPKSILHALWECPELSCIWDSLPAFSFRQTRTLPIFNDLVIYVNEEGKDLNLMEIIMWTIWFRRNQIRVSNKDYSTTQVIPSARQSLSNFHRANPITYPRFWTLIPHGFRGFLLLIILLRSNMNWATFSGPVNHLSRFYYLLFMFSSYLLSFSYFYFHLHKAALGHNKSHIDLRF